MNNILAYKITKFCHSAFFRSRDFDIFNQAIKSYPQLIKTVRKLERKSAKSQLNNNEMMQHTARITELYSSNYFVTLNKNKINDIDQILRSLKHKGSRKHIKDIFKNRKNDFLISVLLIIRFLELNQLNSKLGIREPLSFFYLVTQIKSFLRGKISDKKYNNFADSKLKDLFPTHSTVSFFRIAITRIKQDQFQKTISTKTLYQKRYDLKNFKKREELLRVLSIIEKYAQEKWSVSRKS